jgi:uncharacterized protein (TIGR03000 family)
VTTTKGTWNPNTSTFHHNGVNTAQHGTNVWHNHAFDNHDFHHHHNHFFFFAPGFFFYPFYWDYWPWYWAYWNYPSWYYNYYPCYYYFYDDPAPYPATADNSGQAPSVGDSKARIEVLLPDPEAQVLMDGYRTSSTGTNRVFETPPLSPGKIYSYRLAASWAENGKFVTREKEVMVAPGKVTVVDFTMSAKEALGTVTAKQ